CAAQQPAKTYVKKQTRLSFGASSTYQDKFYEESIPPDDRIGVLGYTIAFERMASSKSGKENAPQPIGYGISATYFDGFTADYTEEDGPQDTYDASRIYLATYMLGELDRKNIMTFGGAFG